MIDLFEGLEEAAFEAGFEKLPDILEEEERFNGAAKDLREEINRRLEKFGRQGWELVEVTPCATTFRREKE